MVGEFVGFRVGETVGPVVGFRVGDTEGPLVGFSVGEAEGGCVEGANEMEGDIEGELVEGIEEGISEGTLDSVALGPVEGAGLLVGEFETEGRAEGKFEGDMVGAGVNRSLAAAAKSVLASRRTTVSSMDLIVNLKRLSGRLMVDVDIFSGCPFNFGSHVKGKVALSISLAFATIPSEPYLLPYQSCCRANFVVQRAQVFLNSFKNAKIKNQNVRVGL
jgi:hypothetical protein